MIEWKRRNRGTDKEYVVGFLGEIPVFSIDAAIEDATDGEYLLRSYLPNIGVIVQPGTVQQHKCQAECLLDAWAASANVTIGRKATE